MIPPAGPANFQTPPRSIPARSIEEMCPRRGRNADSIQRMEERRVGSQAERNLDRVYTPRGIQDLENEAGRRNPGGRRRSEEVIESRPGKNECPRVARRIDWEEEEARSREIRRSLQNEGSSTRQFKEERKQAQFESTVILAQVKEMVDQWRAEMAEKNKEEDSFRVSSPFTRCIQEYEMPEKLSCLRWSCMMAALTPGITL